MMNATWMLSLMMVSGQAPQAGDVNRQVTELNRLTGTEAIRSGYRNLITNREAGKRVVDAAIELLAKKSDGPEKLNTNALYVLGRSAFHLRRNDAGEKFLRDHITQSLELQSPSKILQGYNALIFNLYEVGRFAQCEKACQELLDLNLPESADEEGLIKKAQSNVLRRLLMCQARQGNLEKAEQVLKRLERGKALRPIGAADLRCRLLREAGKLEETLKAYQALIDLVDNDEEIKDKDQKVEIIDDLRYSMTGVLMEMKKVDEATSILEQLLKKEPGNPTYNNDLGYIWADNNKNLDKCEQMIRKAIEEDRKLRLKTTEKSGDDAPDDNASYLDSLGWVLHKKGKNEEALKPLLAASRMEGGLNLEIYDHLGDVLAALGKKEEARKAYLDGIDMTSASRRDQAKKAEVEKKVKALK